MLATSDARGVYDLDSVDMCYAMFRQTVWPVRVDRRLVALEALKHETKEEWAETVPDFWGRDCWDWVRKFPSRVIQ